MRYRWFPVFLLLLSGLSNSNRVAAQAPAALSGMGWRTDWDRRTIDMNELQVNIPRDAIPAIADPRFVSIDEARTWMKDREPVVALVAGDDIRAYPLQILIWHEIVNDVIGGVPVAVTFCPLCYSALAFDRRIDGTEYHFGVSGMLRHSDLVMFDRETHTLWQQLSGEGIVGQFSGTVLKQVPAQIISFGEFRSSHPLGSVLSRNTGFDRRYGQNPYEGYDDIMKKPWLFRGPYDDRLPPMERVVTVTIGSTDKAYPQSITRRKHVIHDTIEGQPLVVFHVKNGASSALDKTDISNSRIIGSTGVFDPRLDDGRTLTFSYKDDRFVDDLTESSWDVTGKAVSGDLAGRQLVSIPHGDIFSFAWFVIKPNTLLYR